jgi:hypothetical protein
MQQLGLHFLKNNPALKVWSTDKNLGPIVTTTECYVNRALKDHLNNTTTHREIIENAVKGRMLAKKDHGKQSGGSAPHRNNQILTPFCQETNRDRTVFTAIAGSCRPICILLYAGKDSQVTMDNVTSHFGCWKHPSWAWPMGQ